MNNVEKIKVDIAIESQTHSISDMNMKRLLMVVNGLGCVVALLASPGNSRAEEQTFKVGNTSFTRPAKWEWVEVTSSMRKAQLKVTDEKTKESAEVVFFQFESGPMGGVQANVNRWFGQFEEPRDKIHAKTEETTVGKTKVTYARAEGTYKSGMPGGTQEPRPDYALEGAIFEAADGTVFVKMTGPKALVKASAADFRKMVESGLK
jgi:hypothetical protein